jgi:hypothetical protein
MPEMSEQSDQQALIDAGLANERKYSNGGMFSPYMNTVTPLWECTVYHTRAYFEFEDENQWDYVDKEEMFRALGSGAAYSFTIPSTRVVINSDGAAPSLENNQDVDVLGYSYQWSAYERNFEVINWPVTVTWGSVDGFPRTLEAFEEEVSLESDYAFDWDFGTTPYDQYYASNHGKDHVINWVHNLIEDADPDPQYGNPKMLQYNKSDIHRDNLKVDYDGNDARIG